MRNQPADLVILDIDMLGMDGFALSMSIRSFEKHIKTPIIFLTGNSIKENVSMAIQSGGNDFITKPLEHNTLFSKIAKHLQ